MSKNNSPRPSSKPSSRQEYLIAVAIARTGGNYTPFTIHGTPKHRSASVRRPGYDSANCKPSCTAKQAAQFVSASRPMLRRMAFLSAMQYVNKVAGGEPRAVRRLMAHARSKRKLEA